MVFATLFPLGVIQLYHSVSSGYFDARTLQFITGGANPVLEWLRLPGDVIFIVGGVLPILGTDKEGQVKYSKGDFFWQSVSLLHSECLLCYFPATLMRFPRVKADGQGFYHCVSRVVERHFIFTAVTPRLLARVVQPAVSQIPLCQSQRELQERKQTAGL
jgi:hypothetical protein